MPKRKNIHFIQIRKKNTVKLLSLNQQKVTNHTKRVTSIISHPYHIQTTLNTFKPLNITKGNNAIQSQQYHHIHLVRFEELVQGK